MTAAFNQCRYLGRRGEQCTAEVLDDTELAEIWICAKHAGRVLEMVKRRAAAAKAAVKLKQAIGSGR